MEPPGEEEMAERGWRDARTLEKLGQRRGTSKKQRQGSEVVKRPTLQPGCQGFKSQLNPKGFKVPVALFPVL